MTDEVAAGRLKWLLTQVSPAKLTRIAIKVGTKIELESAWQAIPALSNALNRKSFTWAKVIDLSYYKR